jgi:hypothetical protein
MEALSLKTLALLEVLKDATKLKHLPKVYCNLCDKIVFHIKEIHGSKTEIYKRNCIVGSVKWFVDLRHQVDMFYGFGDCSNPIDQEIIDWCKESLEKLSRKIGEYHDEDVCPVCNMGYWRYSKWSCDVACACEIMSHSDGSDSDY